MTDHVPDREKLATLREAEVEAFARRIPRSRALYAEARQTMPDGVPCSWMAAFYPGTEIFAARGEGAYFEDVDGNRFLDMTQCDLSMACGFGPAPVARAVAERFAAGSHFLLPTEDAIAVTKNLANRFGMPFWQSLCPRRRPIPRRSASRVWPQGVSECWCLVASTTVTWTRLS